MATIIERLSGKGPVKKSGVSRREFLKRSGVMIVGFSTAPSFAERAFALQAQGQPIPD